MTSPAAKGDKDMADALCQQPVHFFLSARPAFDDPIQFLFIRYQIIDPFKDVLRHHRAQRRLDDRYHPIFLAHAKRIHHWLRHDLDWKQAIADTFKQISVLLDLFNIKILIRSGIYDDRALAIICRMNICFACRQAGVKLHALRHDPAGLQRRKYFSSIDIIPDPAHGVNAAAKPCDSHRLIAAFAARNLYLPVRQNRLAVTGQRHNMNRLVHIHTAKDKHLGLHCQAFPHRLRHTFPDNDLIPRPQIIRLPCSFIFKSGKNCLCTLFHPSGRPVCRHRHLRL